MRIRYKFRALLAFVAIVAIYVALQLHVTNKAIKFAEEMRKPCAETRERLMQDANPEVPMTFLWGPGDNEQGHAILAPLSFADVILIRRRCEVTFATMYLLQDVRLEREYKHIYRLSCFGQVCESKFAYTSADVIKRAW